MLTTIVWLVIVCGVAAVAMWAIKELAPPDPIGRVARVVIIVIALLIIIGLVASIFGVDVGMPKVVPT